MSRCEGGLIKISTVPEPILNILTNEVNDWDYLNDKQAFDKVFGFHKAKVYHSGPITNDIHFSRNIEPVVNWVENIAGLNHKAVRCFLNLMEPNQSFNLHVDTLKVHLLARRFHIPVLMGEGCEYLTYIQNGTDWKEVIHEMEYGNLYELDNIRPHNVKNKDGYRINFICDVLPKEMIVPGLTNVDITQALELNKILTHGLA